MQSKQYDLQEIAMQYFEEVEDIEGLPSDESAPLD